MNRRLFIAFVILAGACAVPAAWGQRKTGAAPVKTVAEPAPGAAVALSMFQNIGEYNIFDSNRTGPMVEGPRNDTIGFVGTMDSSKGRVAFFDGSNAAYRKVVHEGDAVADYTVAKITGDHVELARDSKTVSLVLGQQLVRPPGEEWTVGPPPAAPRGSPSVFASPGVSAPAAAASTSIPDDASAVLKKLMQQRQQELKQ